MGLVYSLLLLSWRKDGLCNTWLELTFPGWSLCHLYPISYQPWSLTPSSRCCWANQPLPLGSSAPSGPHPFWLSWIPPEGSGPCWGRKASKCEPLTTGQGALTHSCGRYISLKKTTWQMHQKPLKCSQPLV